MDLQELLRKSGFSEKEVAVYFAMITLGPSVASDIAEHAGLNRSTAYVILETLTKRNLVNSSEGQGVKLFTPSEPEQIVEYLERASEHFKGLAKQARKLLPSLKKAAHAHAAPESDSAFGAALTSLENIRSQAPAKSPRSTPAKASKPKFAHGTS